MKGFRPARKRIEVTVGESVRVMRELQEMSQNQDRDRDEAGRARQARPRDELGRPLPYGETGVEPVSEEPLPPLESVEKALVLVREGVWEKRG